MLNVLYSYTFFLIAEKTAIKVLQRVITASTMEWK
jgi:hypothetical protein